MALTYNFIGYRKPEADKNSALAQAYEYLLDRLTAAQYNFAQATNLKLIDVGARAQGMKLCEEPLKYSRWNLPIC